MLPQLREELSIFPAPRLADGQPSWTLHDPTRNRFFQIDWLTFEVLSRWALGNAEVIAEDIGNATTLHPAHDEVLHIASFLAENELLQPAPGPALARQMAARLQARKGSLWQRLLHGYLFFRIPLLRPDAWLSRLAPRLDFFYSTAFFRLSLLAFFCGVALVGREWDRFSASLVDTLTWNGLLTWSVALVGVKLCHELGHAVTAKRYGCRIPTIGVAFMVLLPMAYTDTNETWKLARRRERFGVAAAGVATELLIAVWATLFWALLPEGVPKTVAFVLATITWVMSVAINCSPFMRFDGYFLLVDWLNLPNLHERSFALARWQLRELLFGLGEAPPEIVPAGRRNALVAFAWGCWLYRFFLFLGIALLVYHAFAKALGIILFAVEIGWFILRPAAREAAAWKSRWPTIRGKPRGWLTMLAALSVLGLLFVPWPTRLIASGQLQAADTYPLYAPSAAQVKQLPIMEGTRIAAGELLVELASPALESRRQTSIARVERLQQQAAAAGFAPEMRAQLISLQEQLATAEAELAGVNGEIALLALKAPFAGHLRDLDPDLKPGMWLKNRERIGTLVGQAQWRIEAYFDEETLNRLALGDHGLFFADGMGGSILPLHITAIDTDATHVMPSGLLTAPAGGSVVVRQQAGQRIPERAAYRVLFAVDGDPDALAGHAWRGDVVVHGQWEAPGLAFARSALALLWREFGF
ncbi:MAG: site-2 protease family protein [Rhodocyclaceae bacterium]